MIYLNGIQWFLFAVVLAIFTFGGLICCFEKYLPSFVVELAKYGKVCEKPNSRITVQVPKYWFRHFYIYASTLFFLGLYWCVDSYVFKNTPPNWIKTVLDYFAENLRAPKTSATRSILGLSLMTLQCLKRLYETHLVSINAKKAKIHVGHYVFGFLHYSICFLAILGEAPSFSKLHPADSILRWSDLTMKDLFACCSFFWAWWLQYRTLVLLANLRKDKNGKVVTESYKIPIGGWFEYVSSPHNFFEIVIYSSLAFILWPNMNWLWVAIFVAANQVVLAIICHQWYVQKFEDYPKNRKIVFPFIF